MSLDKQKLRILSLLGVLAGFHFVGVGVRAPRGKKLEAKVLSLGHCRCKGGLGRDVDRDEGGRRGNGLTSRSRGAGVVCVLE